MGEDMEGAPVPQTAETKPIVNQAPASTETPKIPLKSKLGKKLQTFFRNHKTLSTVVGGTKLVGNLAFQLSDDGVRLMDQVDPNRGSRPAATRMEDIMTHNPTQPARGVLEVKSKVVAGNEPPKKVESEKLPKV